MKLAEERGLMIVERHIKPEELSTVREVFLTGTAVEVTPVSEIGEYNFAPGEVTKLLMQDYDKLVMRQGDRAAVVNTSVA